MREKWPKQMPLMSHILDHPQSQELEVISGIIDANPTICEHILQDLNRGKSEAQRAGAKGMSAEQVLRCIIVKVLFGFTYEALAFHIVDSQSLRWFCRIGIAEEGFKKSALNRNIKVVSDRTWEMINRDILGYAFSEFEIKRIQKVIGRYIGENRPAMEIRDEVDLSFRIERQSVLIFEIRPLWENPKEKIEEPIAKATYVKNRSLWKVFWQRADLKWHRYDPDPEVDSIDDFVKIVERDEYACFFG